MGLRFQRRIRLFPGMRLNFSKSGVSTSFGRRGAWFTFGPRGQTRETIGLPGTGLRWTEQQSAHAHAHEAQEASEQDPAQQFTGWPGFVGLVIVVAITAAITYLMFKYLG